MSIHHTSLGALLFASISLGEPARAPVDAAQDSAAPTGAASNDEAFAAELTSLTKAFADAQNAYYEPFTKAKSEEEREKIHLDPALHPSKTFVPKFQDLARRAEGTETGVKSWMWIVKQARGSDAQAAIETLTTRYIQSEGLTELASYLRYVDLDPVGQVPNFLHMLIAQSPHRSVRALATCSLAYVSLNEAGDNAELRARARELYVQVQSEYPDTKAAKQAERALFEMDHLQIGMTAPDIEATDVDGVAFKLSDYRGKVVVLDFWGNW